MPLKSRVFSTAGHVLRLFDDANHTLIAAGIAAEDTRVDVGRVAADRTVRHVVFDVAHRLAQPIGIFARRPQDVEGQTLRPLGTNPGQTAKLIDETNERIRVGQGSGQWSVVVSIFRISVILSSTFSLLESRNFQSSEHPAHVPP